MGCDIHLSIESRPVGGSWRHALIDVRAPRDYEVFSALAGVRRTGDVEFVERRGMPVDASILVGSKNTLCVVAGKNSDPDCCTQEQAKGWVESGVSRMVNERFVTNPDWHSHTWLTTAEFRAAIERVEAIAPEWWAYLAFAEELERRGRDARFVMWFDN